MKNISGIYIIKNLVNQKIYVGSSKNITRRWKDHKQNLGNKKHVNKYLQFSWNKYQSHNFKFEIIEEVPIENLSNREEYWCNIFDSHNKSRGYNLATVIRGGCFSETDIKQRRDICKNKKRIYVTTRKGELVNIFSSHIHAAKVLNTTPSHIHFLTKGKVNLFKGQFLFWDTLFITQKMINSRIVIRNEDRKKIIYQFDLERNFIQTFPSLKEAVSITGLTTISDCLRRKQNSSGGFLWCYTDQCPEKTVKGSSSIQQYTKEGLLIGTFSNCVEAAISIKGKSKGIYKVINKENLSYKNSVWKRVLNK